MLNIFLACKSTLYYYLVKHVILSIRAFPTSFLTWGAAMQTFCFSRFIFTIKGETALLLPAYKGSTLRGGFGHAFRRIVCVFKGKGCGECLLRQQCVYSWVFETPVPSGAQMMQKYTAAPHPFVIEPSVENQETYQVKEEMSFGLVLIGRAIDYLPYFIYAFEELGHIGIGKGKGKYQLVEVAEECPLVEEPDESPLPGPEPTCQNKPGQKGQAGQKEQKSPRKVIYRGHDKTLAASITPVQWPDIIDSPPPSPSRIRMIFLTPTRIKYEDSLTKELEFHVFFRNLLRRISLLSYFHCGKKLDDSEFKDLIEQATKVKTISRSLYWDDWERYSNRQGTRMKMGGFIGKAIYEGNFEPFWPYVRLGEYVHVGKGSGFGLGRYAVERQEGEGYGMKLNKDITI